jgi:predicted dehydrogenase
MIRIGIVGCGRILAAHLRGYRLLRAAGWDGFRVTALCARRTEDAGAHVRRGGPPQRRPVSQLAGDPLAVGDEYLADFQPEIEPAIFTDYRRMFAEGPIDAVNDFTSHESRHAVASAALAAGKHLLVQKPLALTVAAAARLCDEAERRRLVLGVFENARFRPDTRQLRWLFESGRCGELQMVHLANIGQWWAPNRIVAGTPWRHRRAAGGGITLDIGVHIVHHLAYVAGELESVGGRVAVIEKERVSIDEGGRVTDRTPCDAEDTMFMHFATGPGVVGDVSASWAGHGGATAAGPGRGAVYYGSRGRATAREVTLDDGRVLPLADLYARECDERVRRAHYPLGLEDSFALNQLDWLEAIAAGREPENGGRRGLRDLAAALAVLESHHAARTVKVAEVLDGSVRGFQGLLENG